MISNPDDNTSNLSSNGGSSTDEKDVCVKDTNNDEDDTTDLESTETSCVISTETPSVISTESNASSDPDVEEEVVLPDPETSPIVAMEEGALSPAKRVKKVKKKMDKCYFCHGKIAEEDKYYPCNCRFGYVHRECLRQWVYVDGHQHCQVCRLKYHLERQNGVCFICNAMDEQKPLIKPCRCLYITVHTDCINRWYTLNNSNRKCKYCEFEYQITTQVSRKFTKSRAPIIFWFFTILTYLLFLAFLISGTHLITLINPDIQYPKFNYTQIVNGVQINSTSGMSIFLFPGNTTPACFILDAIYLAVFSILVAIGLIYTTVLIFKMLLAKVDKNVALLNKKIAWFKKNQFYLFFGPLVVTPIIHLFGNIHYQIYGAANIISPENSFWMYNGYSFIAGPAGLSILGLVAMFGFIVYMIIKGIYWLLVKENRQIEIIAPPNPEILPPPPVIIVP